MCVGVPVKIIQPGVGYALCEDNGSVRRIDTMLVGDQPEGTWLLVFIDAAREVIDEVEAQKINDALQAVREVMGGNHDIDHLFADLANPEQSNT